MDDVWSEKSIIVQTYTQGSQLKVAHLGEDRTTCLWSTQDTTKRFISEIVALQTGSAELAEINDRLTT